MAGLNTIVRNDGMYSLFPSAVNLIDATISFNQGDFLYLDTTNHLIKKPTLEANGGTFLGIALESIVLGKPVKPYVTDVDASAAIVDVAGPALGLVVKAVAKTGDAFVPGQSVYLDPATGTRGVATTGTKAIGLYQGKSITAVAGQEIEIRLCIGNDLPKA